MTENQPTTEPTIPDDLARELCQEINLWEGGVYCLDEDDLVDALAPIIARHMIPKPAVNWATGR